MNATGVSAGPLPYCMGVAKRFEEQYLRLGPWLARLTFSFFLLAAVAAYAAMQAGRRGEPWLPWAGAAVITLLLAMAGLRERHRRGSPFTGYDYSDEP